MIFRGSIGLVDLKRIFGADEFGDVTEALGVGTSLNHARNDLEATVYNMEHTGFYETENRVLQWGVKYQKEEIIDKLNEWELIDSSWYSLPHMPDFPGYIADTINGTPVIIFGNDTISRRNEPFELFDAVRTNIKLLSNRYSGFLQNSWSIENGMKKFMITAGVRANYWDLNEELLLSPRLTMSYHPDWKNDLLFRFSTGYYYQPPFYRELRDLNGGINTDLKAQKSIHFVGGTDWNFKSWNRPFKICNRSIL